MKPKPSLRMPSRIFDRFAALRVLDRIPRCGSIPITGAAELTRFLSKRSVTHVSEHVSLMYPVYSLTKEGRCTNHGLRLPHCRGDLRIERGRVLLPPGEGGPK